MQYVLSPIKDYTVQTSIIGLTSKMSTEWKEHEKSEEVNAQENENDQSDLNR